MSEEVKRMNYFDGLFLKEDEFNLEQNYHSRMRRLHNRYLHSWGIVWGLKLDPGPGPKEITVKEGMALNKALVSGEELSQEIILTSDTPVSLSAYSPNDVVYVYISYSEELADVVEAKGGAEKIHWSERALIAHSKIKPVKENENLILATVTIKADGTIDVGSIKYVDDIGNSLRTNAGFSGESLATKKLTLNIEGVTSNLASIEGKIIDTKNGIQVNSPITNLSGDLSIQGDLTVKGTTTTVDTQNLVIEDNIITVNKYTPAAPSDPPKVIKSGLEVYRGGAATKSQVIWDESTDRWKMGIDPYLFDIVYGTDVLKLIDNVSIVDFHRHNKLYGNPAVLGLSVDNSGNVGIGTTSPQQNLSVNGAMNLDQANVNSGTVNPALTFGSGSGEGIASKRTATGNQFGLDFYTGFVNRMSITQGGNIGIGTASPQQNLSINGAMNLDQANVNNGTVNPALTFGSGSGEGIASKRTATGNQFGLDFYTGFVNRMSITQGGFVGIGTTSPLHRLHVTNSGGFGGENADGTSQAGNVPLVLQSDGTVFGFLNSSSRQAFALNLEGNGLTTSARGYPVFYDKYDGSWHSSIYLRNGNVGIGTASPQQNLSVNGGMNLDQASANNGTVNSALTFGSGSGEAIASKRTATGNQYGLDFYTAFVNRMSITNGGNVGIGTTTPAKKLEVNGSQKITGRLGTGGYDPDSGYPPGWGGGIHTWDIAAHGTGKAVSGWQAGSWDLAEKFEKYDESLEPGDVVVADTSSSEKLIKSTDPYQDNLLGVISEKPGFLLGVNWEDPQYPTALALAGRVKVKVNMEGGPIREGDYLTSSSEESYAMKANRSGRVIGIALESFDGSQGSKGKVVVFVNPHWWGGRNT